MLNDAYWLQRVQEIRDLLDPISMRLPVLLARKDHTHAQAADAYDMIDRLSERAAELLDDMDRAEAPSDIVQMTETLRDNAETLRQTISGKHLGNRATARLIR